jgi:hypothetical protein
MKMTFIVYVIMASLSLGGSGCSSVVVVSTSAQGNSTTTTNTTLHRLFLGYVANNKFPSPCADLQRVEVRTTFWQGLLTVTTLGIYAPTNVKYICSVIVPPDPVHPVPSATDSTRNK